MMKGIVNYSAWLRYVETYTRKAAEVKSRGYKMSNKMYTETQFYGAYIALKNDREIEIESGDRKSMGNIVKDLVNRQVFANSREYSRRIADAYERTRKLTGGLKAEKSLYTKIRYGVFQLDDLDDNAMNEFWNEVSNIRRSYLDQGLTSSEASAMLAMQVFGS